MNLSSFFSRKSSPRTSTSSTARLDRSSSSSLCLPPPSYSIRIDGAESLASVCRIIGLSGPDDFAVDSTSWERHKIHRALPPPSPPPVPLPTAATGIQGARPPMHSAPADDRPWDLVRSFGSLGGSSGKVDDAPSVSLLVHGSGTDGTAATWSFSTVNGDIPSVSMLGHGRSADGTAATSSFSTMNDDDCSSTTTEVFWISPNFRSRRRIGTWTKGKEIGRGSFGTVYEAISEEGGFFAVKEFSLGGEFGASRHSILDLEREITILSQCEHKNIVRYLGTEKDEDKFYIFLELVSQGSLLSLYRKYNLQDSQVSAYTRQILHGLQYLHDRKVIHRDIKCANILVDAHGSAKLADFGLAKQTTNFESLKSCRGSVFWMAPEVVIPDKSYGPPVDIWSLGCTVLEMLTGRPPFMSDQQPSDDKLWVRAFCMLGKGMPPEIPESLSPDARDFIDRCIQVNPSDRLSAADLLDHPFIQHHPLRSFASPGSPFHRRLT